jgi:hypothetical protein
VVVEQARDLGIGRTSHFQKEDIYYHAAALGVKTSQRDKKGARLKVYGSRYKAHGTRLKVQGARFKVYGDVNYNIQDSLKYLIIIGS